ASEDQLFRLAISNQLHQSRTTAGAGDQTDVVLAKTKLRLIGCDSNVARQSDLQTGSGARTVDRRKYRLLDLLELIEELSQPMVFSAKLWSRPIALEILDVAACRKGAPRTG